MGKKIMDYAELKEAYYKLLNDNTDLLDVKHQNDRLKEQIKNLKKQIVELSILVKVSRGDK